MCREHILVIGAGAIGSVVAARLTAAGCNTTLVASHRRFLELRDHPVAIASGEHQKRVMVPVSRWDGLCGKADICIFCTKTGDLADVLEAAAPHLVPNVLAITLQNGVEAPGQASAGLPGAAVVAGRVHGFFERQGSMIRHVGVTPSVALGGVNAGGRQREFAAAGLLAQAGLSATVSPDIVHDLWKKMMLTACLGAVAAALGVAAGQVLAAPQGEPLLRAALEDLVRLAAACGARLVAEDIEETVSFIAGFPTNATTSLQRDLAQGVASEYDALVGSVIRLAASHGQPVPVFLDLDARIRRRFLTATRSGR